MLSPWVGGWIFSQATLPVRMQPSETFEVPASCRSLSLPFPSHHLQAPGLGVPGSWLGIKSQHLAHQVGDQQPLLRQLQRPAPTHCLSLKHPLFVSGTWAFPFLSCKLTYAFKALFDIF